MTKVFIQQSELGPMQNFIYFLGDPVTMEMAVVDPAWDVPFIVKEVKRLGYTLKKVFLTHGHHDHVNGLPDLLAQFDIPVFLCKHETPSLTPHFKNMVFVTPGEKVSLGTLEFDTIHTPGHTPGGMCYYLHPHLIVGDTVFIDACGRADFSYSSPKALRESFQLLSQLPDDVVIYPGHNYHEKKTDTLGNQKRTNRFFRE